MTVSSRQFVPINDCVKMIHKWNPARESKAETFQYIDIASISQSEKRIVPNGKLPVSEAPSRARQLVRTGDVLVSTVRPNLNAVAYVSDEMDGATASTGFCVLRPDTQILDSRYLFHWVRTPQFVKEMVKQATGQSYPAISDKIVKQSLIRLSPLDEQRRIAAILDQVDVLRRLRQRSIEQIDRLGHSIFYDVFGDVVSNSQGWPDEKCLGEVAEIVSGITKGRKANGKAMREVPYLAVVNVQERELRLDPLKTIEATEDEIARYRLRKDDLLLTEGGDPDKLGRGTLWNDELPECIHQNHVFRVRLVAKDIEPLFLNWLVGSNRGKAYFLRSAKQTTGIASINMTQLKGFPLLIPPIGVQRKFASRIAQIQASKQRLSKSVETLDLLTLSLQQRAFRGEL